MSGKSRTRGVDAAIVVLAVVVVACAVWFGYYLGRLSVANDLKNAVGEASSAMQDGASVGKEVSSEPVEPQVVHDHVFEGDVATVTYRDKMEPTQGNAMYNFALENKTDRTVLVSGENVVINGEYSVQTLGGSAVPIAPGTTGLVSLLFGYSVQTPIQSMEDIGLVTCDLVMYDNDSLTTEVGRISISVEV